MAVKTMTIPAAHYIVLPGRPDWGHWRRHWVWLNTCACVCQCTVFHLVYVCVCSVCARARRGSSVGGRGCHESRRESHESVVTASVKLYRLLFLVLTGGMSSLVTVARASRLFGFTEPQLYNPCRHGHSNNDLAHVGRDRLRSSHGQFE